MSPRPIEFPVDGLSDGVVHLRLIAEADIPAIVDAVQDPEIPRWTRVPDPYSEEDGRHFHRMATTGREAGTDLATVIVDADDGHLLGTIALHNIDPENGRCTGGYWIAAPERRRGVARRALALLCRYGFEELDVQRIELWIDPTNTASLRVAVVAGFHREGLLRSFVPIRGEAPRHAHVLTLAGRPPAVDRAGTQSTSTLGLLYRVKPHFLNAVISRSAGFYGCLRSDDRLGSLLQVERSERSSTRGARH